MNYLSDLSSIILPTSDTLLSTISSPESPPIDVPLPAFPEVPIIATSGGVDLSSIPTPDTFIPCTETIMGSTSLSVMEDGEPLPPGVSESHLLGVDIKPVPPGVPGSVPPQDSPDSSNFTKQDSNKSLNLNVKSPADLFAHLATTDDTKLSPIDDSPMDMDIDTDSENHSTSIQVTHLNTEHSIISSSVLITSSTTAASTTAASTTAVSTTAASPTAVIKPVATNRSGRKSRWGADIIDTQPTQDSHVDSNSIAKSTTRYVYYTG